MKTCTKCLEVKPLDEFHRFANARDGRRSECKTCALRRAKDSYQLKVAPQRDTGEITDQCQECGNVFTYLKTAGRRRMYCSATCKHRAGDQQKKARAVTTPRQCACGSPDVKPVGKPVCPTCKIDRRNPVTGAAKERRRTLRRYGLTQTDWDAMVARQADRCAICRTGKPGGRGELWHIDHDHATGAVRGLLCHGCNLGIGNFRDDPQLLRAAAAYIQEARTRSA